jgi:hypothetical protein
VEDQVDALGGARETVLVAHVADEEAQAVLAGVARLHLGLLELVP